MGNYTLNHPREVRQPVPRVHRAAKGPTSYDDISYIRSGTEAEARLPASEVVEPPVVDRLREPFAP